MRTHSTSVTIDGLMIEYQLIGPAVETVKNGSAWKVRAYSATPSLGGKTTLQSTTKSKGIKLFKLTDELPGQLW